MRKWVLTGITVALMSTNIFALDATALQAVQQYQQEFASTVPDHYKITLSDEQTAKLKSEVLQYAPIQQLTSPEFVVVVNRHPKGQSMSVVLADSQSVEVIGTSKVSTGMTQRKHYYLTPVGIFENKRENGTYRAEGTKNENGVRGLGKKGMRVFDFGWQASHAGRRTAETRRSSVPNGLYCNKLAVYPAQAAMFPAFYGSEVPVTDGKIYFPIACHTS